MTALLRYQAAVLLRSNRWIFPLIAYGALIAVGAASSTPLAEGLDWTAAMLVPVVAFLTRSMLLAEPDASRACVAAAAGPARAQLATLTAALGGGVVLGVAGAVFTLLTSEPVGPRPSSGTVDAVTATIHHPQVFLAGLLTAAVCLFVGAAVGALCNPPLLRHPGAAALATLAVVILALAAGLSPANAAIRQAAGGTTSAAHWPGAVPLLGAVALLAVTWAGSILAATRRERSLA